MHSAESRNWKTARHMVPLQGLQPSVSRSTRESDRPAAGELGRRLRACGQPSGLRRRSIRNWTAAQRVRRRCAVAINCSTALLVQGRRINRSAEPAGYLSGAPSADGHYFACSLSKVPVAICDVTTGTARPIPITDQWREVFNARPLISPDGQRVAYHGVALEEIKIFDLSTSTFKSLTVDPSLFVKISRWRASGDSLLVVLSPFMRHSTEDRDWFVRRSIGHQYRNAYKIYSSLTQRWTTSNYHMMAAASRSQSAVNYT